MMDVISKLVSRIMHTGFKTTNYIAPCGFVMLLHCCKDVDIKWQSTLYKNELSFHCCDGEFV